MNEPIYLDHNATAPLDSRVRDAMAPYLSEVFGNTRSSHAHGARVRAAVERAREQVAELLGSRPEEIRFTSGGSESNNLAVKGAAWATGLPVGRGVRGHLITSLVDHGSIRNAVAFLVREGFEATEVGVDATGRIDPAEIAAALKPYTRLVAVQHANNEVGTVQPIPEVAEVLRGTATRLHVDAAQSVGKLPVRVGDLGADLLALAGHKFGGPQGVGALYVRTGVPIDPLVHGVGHEAGVRSGTLPVALIVGLGEACALARSHQPDDAARLARLRDRLWAHLEARLPDTRQHGHPTARLPHTLNVGFREVDAVDLLEATPGLSASTGAACHSGLKEVSQTLSAMGVTPEWGLGAVRLSLGRGTTEADVDRAGALLVAAVEAQRAIRMRV